MKTLEEVHDILEHLVERLAAVETDLRTDTQATPRARPKAPLPRRRSPSTNHSADVLIVDDLLQMPTAPRVRARPEVLARLTDFGFSQEEVADLVLPKRTLARRNAADEPLTVEETDKALRLQRVAVLAEQVFGDPVKAQRWLRKPKDRLGGETPLAFLASESGARVVEEMLFQIQHGMFA